MAADKGSSLLQRLDKLKGGLAATLPTFSFPSLTDITATVSQLTDAVTQKLGQLDDGLYEHTQEPLSYAEFIAQLKQHAQSETSEAENLYQRAGLYLASSLPSKWNSTAEGKVDKEALCAFVDARNSWKKEKAAAKPAPERLQECQSEIQRLRATIADLERQAVEIHQSALLAPNVAITIISAIAQKPIESEIEEISSSVTDKDTVFDRILYNAIQCDDPLTKALSDERQLIAACQTTGSPTTASLNEASPEKAASRKLQKQLLIYRIKTRQAAISRLFTIAESLPFTDAQRAQQEETVTALESIHSKLKQLADIAKDLTTKLQADYRNECHQDDLFDIKTFDERYQRFEEDFQRKRQALDKIKRESEFTREWTTKLAKLKKTQQSIRDHTASLLEIDPLLPQKEDPNGLKEQVILLETQESEILSRLKELQSKLRAQQYASIDVNVSLDPCLTDYTMPSSPTKIKHSEFVTHYLGVVRTLQEGAQLYDLKSPSLSASIMGAGRQVIRSVANTVNGEGFTAAAVTTSVVMGAPLPTMLKFLVPILAYIRPRLLGMPVLGAILATRYDAPKENEEPRSKTRQMAVASAGAVAGATVDHYSNHKVFEFLLRAFEFTARKLLYWCVTGYHILQRWDKNAEILRSRIEGSGLLLGGLSSVALARRWNFKITFTKFWLFFAGGASLGAKLGETLAQWKIRNQDQYWIEGKITRHALRVLGNSHETLQNEYAHDLQEIERALEPLDEKQHAEQMQVLQAKKTLLLESLAKMRLLHYKGNLAEELERLKTDFTEAWKPIAQHYHTACAKQITILRQSDVQATKSEAYNSLLGLQQYVTNNNTRITSANRAAEMERVRLGRERAKAG